MDISKIAMPEDQKQKCHTIIHGAAVAAGGAGSGLAQVPMADSAVITPIQIGMIVALGKVFDQQITKSAANAILSSMAASFAGRTASQLLVGWLPLFGNAVNAATAASLTELVGWNAAEQFYKNQLNSVMNYKVYAGKEQAQVETDLPTENTEEYFQLENRAEEFLRGRKNKQENREEYNALLNDIEYELDAVFNKHLLDIYDKLLSGKIESKEESPQLFQKFFSDEQIESTKRRQNDDSACVIKIYDVFTEDTGKYRVTAKINYASVHVGETFAHLVDDDPTDEKITILQIGFGDRQWTEKEPDKITTLIIGSNLKDTSALLNQSFICIE